MKISYRQISKRCVLLSLVLFLNAALYAVSSTIPYDARKADVIEQRDQTAFMAAQSASARSDFVTAMKACSRIIHGEGMFLHMNAPGNEQTWKQAHQRVIYLAMRTYETAKHCDAKKLQTNLVLLKNALDAEVRL
jgi:hypothetical protein